MAEESGGLSIRVLYGGDTPTKVEAVLVWCWRGLSNVIDSAFEISGPFFRSHLRDATRAGWSKQESKTWCEIL
jgi:hypothetical protein